MEEQETFQDAIGDLMHGPLPKVEEEPTNPEAPTSESPVEESRLEGDKPEAESEDPKPEGDKAPEEKGEDSEGEAGDPAKPETEEQPAEEDPDPVVFEVDGKPIRRSEAQQGYLRTQDYTRKRQEDSERVKQAEQAAAETRKLVSEIMADEDMQELVRAHPTVLDHLISQPDATRKLLGNSRAIEEFWKDYELIIQNPRLAERFLQGDQQAVSTQREEQEAQHIANTVQETINTVAAEFEGIDKEEVERYFLEVAGLAGDNLTNEQLVAGLKKLGTILLDREGNVNDRLIRDRFEYLSVSARVQKDAETRQAEQHNKQVEDELKTEAAPPAAPASGGGTPAASPPEEKMPVDFQAAINELLYGE